MAGASVRTHFPFHLRREAVNLTILVAMAAALFLLVATLSTAYHSQQDALAARWASRGDRDLKSGSYKAATDDFRAALRYSHDDYDQQLGLAEALLGQKRTSEASAYLVNLWEEQPENGVVNLELARIAAGKGQTQPALRYYHNAIYANWTDNPEQQRRATRWELIKYLLSLKATAQAQSELISLAAEVGDEPLQQTLLGEYFLKVQDDQHALSAFKLRLAVNPHNSEALLGAGTASAELGNYEAAHRYLKRAAEEVPDNHETATMLQTVDLVLRLDPYRRQIADGERYRAVTDSFNTAGDRLSACPAMAAAVPVAGKTSFGQAWQQLKPSVTLGALRKNPDLIDQTMDLVFAVERQAASQCGQGTPADRALLEISKLHEGS